jgi:flagellar M-ring protein FliF
MDLRALLTQLQALYDRLTLKQKLVVLGAIVSVIAFIVFLVVYNGKTSDQYAGYKVLFDNLDPKDSALIVQQLKEEQIPYKLPNESTILVPEDQVYSQRIQMASQGIPKSSNVGYEMFDQSDFGATDFEQRIKYLRALEGELSRTIETLKPIENAEVNIALPKESVFVSQDVPPTASIVVTLAPSMILGSEQVYGIKNLVAASVPKLTIENVKVIDQNGQPLGENSELADSKQMAQTQLKYKQNLEKIYEDKIVNILAPFIGGNDKVVAKVTMELDFDQKESQQEVYDPNNVVRSEQTMEESREGYKPKEIGGVPGAVSNIGPVEGLDENNLKEKYEKAETTTNYEISKTVSKIKGEFAKLERVSAAVVVDGQYSKDGDAIVYTPLPEAELEKINAIVQQTIGFDPERGDQVTVTNFRFDQADLYATQTPIEGFMAQFEQYAGPLSPILKILLVGIILFIFYKKVIVPFAERMTQIPIDDEEDIESLLKAEEDQEEDTLNRFNDMRKKVEDQLGLRGDISEDEVKYEVLLEKMKNIVSEKPEEIASLFTALVRDELSDSIPTSYEKAAKEQM